MTPTTTVEHGQEVQITLTLEEDYTLKAWDSDCGTFSPQETTITFPATKDCQLQAILEKKQYPLQANSTEGGSIDGHTSRQATNGQTVTFTAVADEYHVFARWQTEAASACPTIENPQDPILSFIVTGPCTLQEIFTKVQRTITTSVNEGG